MYNHARTQEGERRFDQPSSQVCTRTFLRLVYFLATRELYFAIASALTEGSSKKKKPNKFSRILLSSRYLRTRARSSLSDISVDSPAINEKYEQLTMQMISLIIGVRECMFSGMQIVLPKFDLVFPK